MPYNLSKHKRDNVKSRIIPGQNTATIVINIGFSKSTVLRIKKKIDPNYSRHLGGRPSLLLSSAHTVMDLKLRPCHVTSIRRVQAYLKRLQFRLPISQLTTSSRR
ncbi:hypothetical protein MAM1_0030d02365 [Mucor ambiguus]|uniref:Uncharacterized protein n=1 Tax=Mucor ambiguus TaxID=91626 RepID=A0A0C9LSL2_9FUNG|nr:hypothetical protein MAM1_0030d02365 [Mucor ambiguus]